MLKVWSHCSTRCKCKCAYLCLILWRHIHCFTSLGSLRVRMYFRVAQNGWFWHQEEASVIRGKQYTQALRDCSITQHNFLFFFTVFRFEEHSWPTLLRNWRVLQQHGKLSSFVPAHRQLEFCCLFLSNRHWLILDFRKRRTALCLHTAIVGLSF